MTYRGRGPPTYAQLLARCVRAEAWVRKKKNSDSARQRAYYARKKAKRTAEAALVVVVESKVPETPACPCGRPDSDLAHDSEASR